MIWPFNRQKPQRQIFKFYDGLKYRNADPLDLWKRLFEGGEEEFVSHSKRMYSKLLSAKERNDSQNFVVDKVRQVFGIKALDSITGKGLTINETLEVLSMFFSYVEAIKKKRDRLRAKSRSLESIGSKD